MARSHRIGQSKRVKVFRLVTRGSYEAELVQAANLKLGLERAMNAPSDAATAAEGHGHEKGAPSCHDLPSTFHRPSIDFPRPPSGGHEQGAPSSHQLDVPLHGGSTNGPPRDRSAVERMLRCGAENIALDDDSAFRRFDESDIESLLETSASTSVLGSAQHGAVPSSFSKVAFVADGEQIDMGDPEFWQKLLPSEGAVAGADAADGEYGRGRRTHHKEAEYADDDDDDDDGVRHGARRQARKRERYCDAGSSGDEEALGPCAKRDAESKPRKTRREPDSEGEDEAVADAKLWGGAHAEGWRVHAKGDAHYRYVAPSGERYGNRGEAFAAAGREVPIKEAAAKPPREPRPPKALKTALKARPASGSRGKSLDGEMQTEAGLEERQSTRTRGVGRQAAAKVGRYAEVASDEDEDDSCLLPAARARVPEPPPPRRPPPPPELPAAFKEAVEAISAAICSAETYPKLSRHVVRVLDSPVALGLEKTATRFTLSYRLGEGGWIEFDSQSGDLASKAERVLDEVERL